jgi:hypothetical protein
VTTKKVSKRKAGKRLNEQGRESPLDVFQLRQEYYSKLAREEIAKGEYGDREIIDDCLKLAQEAAEALAPYRHAKLTPTEPVAPEGPTKIFRVPKPMTMEEWTKTYTSPEASGADLLEQERKNEEWKRKLETHVSDQKPN